MARLVWMILQILYLFLPLLIAAALSGLVIRYDLWPSLRYPIDGNARFRGKRLFGASKTWRGVLTALVGCLCGVAAQKYLLVGVAGRLALLDYAHVHVIPLAVAMAVGAMAGELPNSFVKRQLGIAPGATTSGPLAALFYVWDQVDLLTLTWPLLLFWLRPPPGLVLFSFVVAVAIHPLVALTGYLIGARRSAR